MSPAGTPSACAGEATRDSNDQRSPELSSRDDNDSGGVVLVPDDVSIHTESTQPLEDGIESTIELDDQPTRETAIEHEKETTRDEHQGHQSFTSHRSAASKDEEAVGVEREEARNSTVQDSSFESGSSDQRHRRRSAAPSPSVSFFTATATSVAVFERRFISPQYITQVTNTLSALLSPSADKPDRCACAWYEFQAVCGHISHSEPFKCGRHRDSHSGAVNFCVSPAPSGIVQGYVINQSCAACLTRGSGQRPGGHLGS